MSLDDTSRAKAAETRRSHRLLLRVPVQVRCTRSNGQPFVEHSVSMVVNAHGGLIALATAVVMGQQLNLTNRQNGEEVDCSVVFLGHEQDGKVQVGVEFAEPRPSFWGVAFPPESWLQAN
jgi:hypothetical protein